MSDKLPHLTMYLCETCGYRAKAHRIPKNCPNCDEPTLHIVFRRERIARIRRRHNRLNG